MLGIVILNVIFSAFVIIGILGLLAWGILTDKAAARSFSVRRQGSARATRNRTSAGALARPSRASQLTA
jgi:hypothetical protein